LITLDRFNVPNTEETDPKNENNQLDEYCLLETLRESNKSTSLTQASDSLVKKSGSEPKKEPMNVAELCQMLHNAILELHAL